jgi:hypothetical protein
MNRENKDTSPSQTNTAKEYYRQVLETMKEIVNSYGILYWNFSQSQSVLSQYFENVYRLTRTRINVLNLECLRIDYIMLLTR